MSLQTDAFIDRQRLKRRLTFWRVLAVAALVLAAIVAAPKRGHIGGDHLARYAINGVIGDGREQIEALDKMRKDASVRGVLLHLDTPGGAVGGGEGIHAALQELVAAKPVVAVMDGTAASAGFMIAVAAPHIVARESTLTGSIGVIMELGDFSGLLGKIGIKSDPLVSGPLKGQPSFTAPLSDAGRDYLQALVMDLYDQFVDIVAAGRHMDKARVKQLADGRAYTGRQALGLGLIDEIGGEPEAIKWMQKRHNLTPDLPIDDVKKDDTWYGHYTRSSLGDLILGALGSTMGQPVHVDGVYALWQPVITRN
jgi:protease-4